MYCPNSNYFINLVVAGRFVVFIFLCIFFYNKLFFFFFVFQLGNLERKWCHLEQNNFVMKECMCCFCDFLMIILFVYSHTFFDVGMSNGSFVCVKWAWVCFCSLMY